MIFFITGGDLLRGYWVNMGHFSNYLLYLMRVLKNLCGVVRRGVWCNLHIPFDRMKLIYLYKD